MQEAQHLAKAEEALEVKSIWEEKIWTKEPPLSPISTRGGSPAFFAIALAVRSFNWNSVQGVAIGSLMDNDKLERYLFYFAQSSVKIRVETIWTL
jgi:hypothetical protein